MNRHATALMVLMVAVLSLASHLPAQGMLAAKYEGVWEIQPNGDVKVTRTYEMPMMLYRMWKDADVHMLELREFSSERAGVEVSDTRADWDDVNRRLVLRMTILGLARNQGDHWEAEMLPGEVFSNLDEGKKTAYFHFSQDGQFGRVQGQDIVRFPADAQELSWDAPTRTLRYTMPQVAAGGASGGGSPTLWWVLFGIFAVAGAGLWVASFVLPQPRPA